MFTTILRWECRALRRDRAFQLASGLAVAALAGALINGAAWHGRLAALETSAAAVDAELAARSRALAAELDRAPDPRIGPTRDPRNAYGFAHFQMQHAIALPPTPLAVLATGQSDLLPQSLPLNPGPPPGLLGSAEPENPRRLLVGAFDAAFVVVMLLPLFVIAITCGLIAGERERGTLPLVLSQPVTLRAFVLGRLAPRMLAGVALLAVLALGFVLVSRVSAPLTASLFPRLGLWLVVAFAYVAFWFALSLVVATGRGSTALHALVLATAWLALVVVLPAGINLAVATLRPVPSRLELILAQRAATDRISAEAGRLLAAYYDDHPEFAPRAGAATEYSEIRFITNEHLDRALAPVLARFEDRLARQQALVAKLALLSPALLAQTALADAAGTGADRHRAFLRQAAAHHAELRAFFNPRILRQERFDAWEQLPPFRFAEEPPLAVAGRLLLPLGALVLGTAALAAVALRRLPSGPLPAG